MSWTKAKIIVYYAESFTREIEVTREELEKEQKAEMVDKGATQDDIDNFELGAEQFQSYVYQAARNLSTSPIFHRDKDTDTVSVYGPWHVKVVDIIPQKGNGILLPTDIPNVSKYRGN